jgi:hypothetical protein
MERRRACAVPSRQVPVVARLTGESGSTEKDPNMRSICLQDLDFREVPLTRRSMRGVPYQQWIRVGMPRIPESVVKSVFYLYASKEDALAGRNPGGTGFIVDTGGPAMDDKTGVLRLPHLYGVTNWHVACSAGYSVIRLNTVDGGIDVLDFGPDQWDFLPGKYDVAVIPLDNALDKIHSVYSISARMFVSRERSPYYIGDDTFMLGLFLDHAGVTTNVPSARFGNISMLPNPNATIKQSTGYKGVSYVVDMHSRTGFSGSPVFAYRTFGSDLNDLHGHRFDHLKIDSWASDLRRGGTLQVSTLFHFLGIHWGQFPEEWEISTKKIRTKKEVQKRGLLPNDASIEGMSGMTCVIPAWEISEVLNMPKLKDQRYAADSADQAVISPKPESSPPANGENPST